MKHKPQTRWAIVFANGNIGHSDIAFTRKDCIANIVALYRGFTSRQGFIELTDAQLWRFIKRRRGLSCRRITMRISR